MCAGCAFTLKLQDPKREWSERAEEEGKIIKIQHKIVLNFFPYDLYPPLAEKLREPVWNGSERRRKVWVSIFLFPTRVRSSFSRIFGSVFYDLASWSFNERERIIN
jgi:hypothetical protein